ncbi:hypothetical protein Acr_12g0000830 [Actinidia rufa]|uniref:Uncharacterized protein n=1 Tax=Actinidia rufa TaxID=165716 RepID=A0A7J0FFS6_9ERIC|nr:hypothetical protein Acr_12g0000830 [Actinidia rufa]
MRERRARRERTSGAAAMSTAAEMAMSKINRDGDEQRRWRWRRPTETAMSTINGRSRSHDQICAIWVIRVPHAPHARLTEGAATHPLRGALCATLGDPRLKALRRVPLTTLIKQALLRMLAGNEAGIAELVGRQWAGIVVCMAMCASCLGWQWAAIAAHFGAREGLPFGLLLGILFKRKLG